VYGQIGRSLILGQPIRRSGHVIRIVIARGNGNAPQALFWTGSLFPKLDPRPASRSTDRSQKNVGVEGKMLLYKFEAATPWRVALTNDELGNTLPAEGAPWQASGSVEVEAGKTWACPWRRF
jgi:hypothetical protein